MTVGIVALMLTFVIPTFKDTERVQKNDEQNDKTEVQ